MSKLFKVGDRLKSHEVDYELYGIEYVTITYVNLEKEIYHWKTPHKWGNLNGGYSFKNAQKYKK